MYESSQSKASIPPDCKMERRFLQYNQIAPLWMVQSCTACVARLGTNCHYFLPIRAFTMSISQAITSRAMTDGCQSNPAHTPTPTYFDTISLNSTNFALQQIAPRNASYCTIPFHFGLAPKIQNRTTTIPSNGNPNPPRHASKKA